MPLERLVIVSDAHLGSVPDRAEEAFLAFLDGVPSMGDGLLVNGDLFDFWFAYRRVIPRAGIRVVAQLTALARRLPVMMTGGNHDRWGGSFWEKDLGIRFDPHELRIPLGKRTAVALHGDGIAEGSRSARVMNRITRHPVTSAIYHLMHPDFGIWLVGRMSGHLADSTRDPAVLDAAAARQRLWAEHRLASEPEVALLVMSHTHRPAHCETGAGQHYVNPGAWLVGQRYAIATESVVTLNQFPA
jgi:UDP-2,3-diacylglucosamine hydrolase